MERAARILTFEEWLDYRLVSDTQIAPDGRRVAYVVAETSMAKGEPSPASRVWIAAADESHRPATAGPGTDDLPRWSPDGTLAFRSDRAVRGTGQIYLQGDADGSPRLPHAFPTGVLAYDWSPDGSTIAALVADPAAPRAEGWDQEVVEDESPYARLWLIDVASGDARQVTRGQEHVWEFCWAPDSGSIAVVFSRLPLRRDWYHARLGRVDLGTGQVQTLLEPSGQIARPAWAPDGSTIAVVSCTWSDPGMTGGDVLLVPADGGDSRWLTEESHRSHLSLHWQLDSRSLVTSALERGRVAVCEVAASGRGGTETLWSGERSLTGFSLVQRDGTLVAAAGFSSLNEPFEAWIGEIEAEAEWRRLSEHNVAIAGTIPGEVETLHWQAPDGLEIQGLLIRPNLRATRGPLPLVTMIHGGPTGHWGYGFPGGGVAAWIPGLLARGVAVLMPNPRGSAGWGAGFSRLNHSDMGGGDLEDVLAGVDYCVREGIANPERLGVCGWSYGGYLTAWAVTQTQRFKAAIAGASITDWISFHGTTDIPGFDEAFFRADPYAVDGPYVTRSPIMAVHQVTTPTLFLNGERDRICSVGQPLEMFRALRTLGVPTQCVIYPREGHPIRERAHRHDLLQRGVEWLCRYLDCPQR
jgi:dipeptidyl aminopeptidase/acylaminoacyl peptidase